MKLIPLSRGLHAMVDDDDYEKLCNYNWYAGRNKNTDYGQRNEKTDGVNQYCHKLHRQVMGCTPGDGKIVDHIDGNGLNNQKSNLRFVTRSENCKNNHMARRGLRPEPAARRKRSKFEEVSEVPNPTNPEITLEMTSSPSWQQVCDSMYDMDYDLAY